MRVLLFGAGGQLGVELERALVPLGPVFLTTRSGRLAGGRECIRCDLLEAGAARSCIEAVGPDLVVNAAAYTAVDMAEQDAGIAMRVNAGAVAEIAAATAACGARLIHYSTDYVFDGSAGIPYRENDATGPLGAYGRSKHEGELALSGHPAALTLRIGWLYADHGRNFPATMLEHAANGRDLTVVEDRFGSPTPARWVADVTLLLARAFPVLRGIRHLSPAGSTSWYGYARYLLERADAAGLLGRRPSLSPVPGVTYPTRAARPAYSCLDSSLLREETGIELPDWRLGVDQFIAARVSRRCPTSTARHDTPRAEAKR